VPLTAWYITHAQNRSLPGFNTFLTFANITGISLLAFLQKCYDF
jgi:hypothetical protein